MSLRPYSIIFCGTSDFAVPSLEALAADAAFEIQCVITQPDKPVGRKQELTPPPVKIAAEKLQVPVFQPDTINTFLPISDSLFPIPDCLLVVSYGQILSQDILNFPTIAPVNVHASLLPRFRGASPIQHAILAGDTESGVTIQSMVKELDAGPILAQVKTPLSPRETTLSLHDRLARMGADLLVKTLKASLHPTAQSTEGITVCRKLTRQDGIVDAATMTAEEIDRKVRALNPWPGVTLTMNGQTLKILATELQETTGATPIPCKNNTILYVTKLTPAGGKPMMGVEWARGRGNR